MIILLPHTTKQGPQFKWPEENKYPITTDLNAESFVDYFNRYLPGLKVPLPEPVSTNYTYYLFVPIIVFSIFRNFYQYRYERNFWMSVCMFIVWFTYTGTIWNINRGPPFILGGKGLGIIYPQQRMQTVLEGLIVASLLLIIAGIFIAFGTYIPTIRDVAEQRNYFYWAVTAISISYMMLHVIWLSKTPWYLMYS